MKVASTAAALRQARRREREKQGVVVLQVEVAELDLAYALRVAGFLQADNPSRDELASALGHVVEIWTESVTRDFQG